MYRESITDDPVGVPEIRPPIPRATPPANIIMRMSKGIYNYNVVSK
jgi:hypothetical protein